jgi:hypothetical protein
VRGSRGLQDERSFLEKKEAISCCRTLNSFSDPLNSSEYLLTIVESDDEGVRHDDMMPNMRETSFLTRFDGDANGDADVVKLDGVQDPLQVLLADVHRLVDGSLSRLPREDSLFCDVHDISDIHTHAPPQHQELRSSGLPVPRGISTPSHLRKVHVSALPKGANVKMRRAGLTPLSLQSSS